MRYSDRKGITELPKQLSNNSFSERAKNRLWNAFKLLIWSNIRFNYRSYEAQEQFVTKLWHDYFGASLNNLNPNGDKVEQDIHRYFFSSEYYLILNLLEYLASNFPFTAFYKASRRDFEDECNRIFSEEFCGFRFINGQVVDISDPNEIAAVEEASSQTDIFSSVALHINKALSLLS